MKIEEIVILGLTGAAAYLYWKMRSQKTAVVTSSATYPMTYSPSSTAVVPVDSAPPSMPTMPMPSLPEPVSSSLATPVVLQVGPNERPSDVLKRNGYFDLNGNVDRCIPKNVKLQLSPCNPGTVRESFPVTADMPICAEGEHDNPWRGTGKCVSPEDNKLLSQTKPLTVPQGPIEPMVVFQGDKMGIPQCIPKNQIVSVQPCPEGQERRLTPCTYLGGPRYPPPQSCPSGYYRNMNAYPCDPKCTGKSPVRVLKRGV
jgi:hypothetical protein